MGLKIAIFTAFFLLKLKIQLHCIFMSQKTRIVLLVQYCPFIYKRFFNAKLLTFRVIPLRIQTFHDFEVGPLLRIVFEHAHPKLFMRRAMYTIIDELATKNVCNFSLRSIAEILLDLRCDLIYRKLSHGYRLLLLIPHYLLGLDLCFTIIKYIIKMFKFRQNVNYLSNVLNWGCKFQNHLK